MERSVQAVQYMTCDHIWVINAGLIPDSTMRVCRAVMKDMMSEGDGGDGPSGKSELKGVVLVGGRPRVRLFRMVWPSDVFGVTGARGGDTGGLGDEGAVIFFFEPKDRRNDHSDSN
jgi:hypothetical protein